MWGIVRFDAHQKDSGSKSNFVQVGVKLEALLAAEPVVIGDPAHACVLRTSSHCGDPAVEAIFQGIAKRRQVAVPILDLDWPRGRL